LLETRSSDLPGTTSTLIPIPTALRFALALHLADQGDVTFLRVGGRDAFAPALAQALYHARVHCLAQQQEQLQPQP
jgi:hypothetical protein